MRVLLIYPNLRQEIIGYGDLGAIAEPLALEYLGAGAKLDGHDVQILDLRLHQDALDATLRDFAPEIVGVTGYSMHVSRCLALCRRVREVLPGCRTVVGGHHATLLPEDFFEPEIDFVVGGEGVHSFRALLRDLESGRLIQGIPGLWSRVEGRFVSGGEPLSFAIDDLPLPDRTLTAGDRHAYFIDWMKPVALLRTTVGCPYRCSFCALWKIQNGLYHRRDIHRVVEEIAAVEEECIFLVDDEAFVNGRRMLALARELKAAGVRKRYFAYCRIDTLLRQPELMRAWREVGLERLFIGIEAVTARELGDYNKRVEVVQIETGLRAAASLGLRVFGGFIVNPDYTRREFKQLVRFIEHNKVDYPSFTVLTPLPGTESLTTFDAVLERQANGRPDWDLFDLQHPVTATRLPKEEFEREYRNLYRVFGGHYSSWRPEIELQLLAAREAVQ